MDSDTWKPLNLMDSARTAMASAGAVDILVALTAASVLWYAASAVFAWRRLRHFPGPPLASFSYAWGFLMIKRGRMERVLAETQRRYGPIMRIGPNELMVYDPDTLWHINGVRSSYTRGGWYQSLRMDPSGESILSEPDTARHDARKAQVTAPYAGPRRLVNLEAAVDSQLAVLVDLLATKYAYDPSRPGRDGATKALDFGGIIHDFTIDVMTLIVLGKPWGNVANETDTFQFVSIMDAFLPYIQLVAVVPLLRSFFTSSFFLALAGPKPTDKAGMGQFLGVAKKDIEKRLKIEDSTETGPSNRNLLDEWLKQGLTPAEVQREVTFHIPAGTETTTTVFRGTMLYLLSSPPTYRKLKDEIAQGIKDGRISSPITDAEARALPYLHAVICEGFRVVPPTLMGFSKRVPPNGDTICGKFVPGGTDIMVNMFAMLRNRDVFGEDADVFRPERFIESDEKKKAQQLKVMDLAFGHGRWGCPGKALAWIELNKVFVALLRRFDFQIHNPENPWRCIAYQGFMIDGFWVKVLDGKLD